MRAPGARLLRFTFLLLAALCTGLSAVGGWRYARASAPVNGPIILISIDSLRADHLPAYGYRKVKTPAIDALAADGTVFERAYAHAPQTLPSHVSILSGRLPFETGVRDNVGFVVKRGERLLPQMLAERGYSTAGIVSSFVLRRDTGIDRGFEFFDGGLPGPADEAGGGDLQRDGAESEAIAERWLDQQRSPRVFLFLHINEPHAPYTPPLRYADYSPYDGEIAYSDEIVGRLIHYLKSHQLYDRSTIVLLSDHGEGLGDHGEQEHGTLLYDEAIHVPLLIKQAAGAGAGRRVADLVQHVDVAPTILDLAKAPIPGSLRGRSLRPALDGTGRLAEVSVYSEALYARYHFGWSELTALTGDRYRYIRAPREEVYDLARDPRERDNIVDDPNGRNRHAALGRALDRLDPEGTIHAPGEVSPEDRERLRSLGYVGTVDEISTEPGRDLPDPKDKRQTIETYREAVRLAREGQSSQPITLLRTLVKDDPSMADVWDEIAALSTRSGRYDQAIDAYQQIARLRPDDPAGHLGAATVLLKVSRLDDARRQAQAAVEVAPERDVFSRSRAHELLARIALQQRDPASARREAELAGDIDPALPMPAFVEARVLYDEGNYDEALPFFQQAIEQSAKSKRAPLFEVHFYTAETLLRLERRSEAEPELLEELRHFPLNMRARAGLATLYHAVGRDDEAAQAVHDLVRVSPTRESFATAARLWTVFGNPREAAAVRAQARQALGGSPERIVSHQQAAEKRSLKVELKSQK